MLGRRWPLSPFYDGPRRSLTTVRFAVDGGPRWYWGRRFLEGAPSHIEPEIRRIFNGHLEQNKVFNQRVLDALHADVVEVLRLDGFTLAQARVSVTTLSPSQPKVDITLRLDPGPRFIFAEPRIQGIDELPSGLRGAIHAELRRFAGSPWLRRNAVTLRARLVGILQSAGYYWARIDTELSEAKADGPSALDALFVVEPGPPVRIASVSIKGLDRTSQRYAESASACALVLRLIREELDAAGDRLRATVPLRRLAMEVTPRPDANAAEADIVVEVEEGPSRFFEAYAGFGSYEGVRGGARYIDNHVFGLGRQWTVGVDGSQKHLTGRSVISDSDLLGFNRPLSLSVEGGYREEPSFEERNFIIRPEVRLPINRFTTLQLAYNLEFNRTTNVSAPASSEDRREDIQRIALFDLRLRYDRLDDLWLPRSGYRLEGGVAVADRLLGSTRDFIELSGSAAGLISLDDEGKWGLAGLLAYKTRKPFDRDGNLPISERVFLGGANSVRSFQRNLLGPGERGDPIGGLTSIHAQAELRFPLAGNLRGAAFYDIGSVSRKSWEVDDDNGIGQGIGLGLRYLLPVGPLRLDAAYNPDNKLAGRNRYALQFAVGFTF